MSKMYNRSIIREIRKSFGRFAAIIAIVALGVGFLVGILSSTPDMKATADQYYKEYAMSDYDLKSTLGFTNDDIAALSEIDEIAVIMPANVMDALVMIGDENQAAGRIYGLNPDNLTINKLELVDGRMPENASECVIENPNSYMEDAAIGDVITISDENEDVENTYTQTQFKVVGIVDSPYYFCSNREPSSAGSGRTGVIIYTYRNAYKTDVYTDLFILTHNKYSAFSDKYDKYIENVTEKIETVSEDRIAIRYAEIINEAMAELDEAKTTLESEKAKAESEFAKAEADLDRGQRQYENGLTQADAAQKELDAAKSQLNAVKSDVEAAKAAQAAGYPLTDEQLAQIAQYDSGLAQWQSGSEDLRKQRSKLENAASDIAFGRAQLRESRRTAEAEFTAAESRIRDAEKEINDIEYGEWYILDRNSNVSYARYSVDVEKVADIATVFPIFFFLVAALVSLTTMTRMVEEERIQIGTLKALGYRRIAIMSKYLIYCGAATVIGCIIGLLAGFQVLPLVIFMAFSSQYTLPPLITSIHLEYALLSCILEVVCTLGATWAACRHTLNEKAAHLMIPRAPKAGKRIFLERIGFIWNRLSFSHKSTLRNVFRYKKHLFMTVIGVAGCTALMVAGFGIQDSLTKLVKTQYDDILKYDMRIELTEDAEPSGDSSKANGAGISGTDATANVAASSGTTADDWILTEFLVGKDHLKVMTLSMDLSSNNNKEIINSTIYVPSQPSQLTDFVSLQERKSGEHVDFNSESVVITEKMADILEVSAGDTVTLTDPDGVSADLELTGITENYAGCPVYIAPDVYAAAFENSGSTVTDTLDYNCYLLKSGITGLDEQERVTGHLLECDLVSSTEFTSQSREIYETIMESLTFLVYVLIIFAGLLAAVVLYNLTNININERIRELAALRVLGYHHKEVAAYIFREIAILSILGVIIGLVLGKILHYYVIKIAESADMVFGRELDLSTYIMAALFTLIFSALVDLLMSRKLKHIDMAASMKAID